MTHHNYMSNLIIISGPSGVGKGSIIAELLEKAPNLKTTISATTRAPREREQHEVDYYFLSTEDFDSKIEKNDFLEWCTVHKNKYGTLKSELSRMGQSGYIVLLEIDTQGAKKIKKQFPQVPSIFISPPSFDTLEKRLRSRSTEIKAQLDTRLERAKTELMDAKEYDYVIIITI